LIRKNFNFWGALLGLVIGLCLVAIVVSVCYMAKDTIMMTLIIGSLKG